MNTKLPIVGILCMVAACNDTKGVTEYRTDQEMRIVYLPDSTKVIMNNYSLVRYSNTKFPLLTIHGEALIEVGRKGNTLQIALNDTCQFTCNSNTQVNITNYHEDSLYKISILNGKISLPSTPMRVLGELETFIGWKDHTMWQFDVSHWDSRSWTANCPTFTRCGLYLLLNRINRDYQVNIQVDDSVKHAEVNYTYCRDTPLQEIISDLEVRGIGHCTQKSPGKYHMAVAQFPGNPLDKWYE